jgi:ATP-dependent DNA helicase RecQ
MNGNIHFILKQYWGFENFRPLQEEIIQSVLNGKDTLALLPTGGGKSICFQVPAMAKEGICIVISPLIALMKDQVNNLKKKGIKAACIVSGMDKREIDILLDNCVFGQIKFLYVSPERAVTPLFRERFKRMKVNLIAIDEAHCISQWGYDFRPPYLRLAELRELKPDVPLLALTATATTKVVADIFEKLEIKNKNLLQKSFQRENLAYLVLKEDDKLNRLLRIAKKTKGSGVIYLRSRKRTQLVADYLFRNGITSTYYHAGLNMTERQQRQDDWIENKYQVMVATNAFGMGIDKPDVRFVVHIDLPDNLEAYFQEAGRAGRDEKEAFAVVLWNDEDLINLDKNFEIAFPNEESIKRTYTAIGNYCKLATGAGEESVFDIEPMDFFKTFSIHPAIGFSSFKILELEELITFSEAFHAPSQMKFIASTEQLYQYQLTHPMMDQFIRLLLRSYPGLFDELVKINENELAKRSGLSVEMVVKNIQDLQKLEFTTYIPKSGIPKVIWLKNRIHERDFKLSPIFYQRKKTAADKITAVKNYVLNHEICRNIQLLKYFDEIQEYRCGKCDVCIQLNKYELSNIEFEKIQSDLKILLEKQSASITEILSKLSNHREDKIKKVFRWLLDNDHIETEKDGKYSWRN